MLHSTFKQKHWCKSANLQILVSTYKKCPVSSYSFIRHKWRNLNSTPDEWSQINITSTINSGWTIATKYKMLNTTSPAILSGVTQCSLASTLMHREHAPFYISSYITQWYTAQLGKHLGALWTCTIVVSDPWILIHFWGAPLSKIVEAPRCCNPVHRPPCTSDSVHN